MICAFLLWFIQFTLILLIIWFPAIHFQAMWLSAGLSVLIISVMGFILLKASHAERALKESETWLSLAHKAADLGTWRYEYAAQQVILDERSAEHLGMPGRQVVGIDEFLTHIPFDVLSLLEAQFEEMKKTPQTNHHHLEFRTKNIDGMPHWIEVQMQVYFTGEAEKSHPHLIVGTTLDISERKHSAEELDRLNYELVRSNTELDQFASIISHDLQEPLRGISGMIGIIKRTYHDKLDEQGLEMIDLVSDASARMKNQIEGLLAYSRVNTRGHPFEQVDANAVVQMVLNSLTLQIMENQAIVRVDPLPTVTADAIQLAQVFQNLINNAIKFCALKPPEVKISAYRKDNAWCFAVKDNGIGIDPLQFGRIFVIFKRLHSQDEYPGNGIGLSICEKIIARHGGKIWVESTPGQGSTFFFTLPISETV